MLKYTTDFFIDKVIFQTFRSINAFSFELCGESELPNNLADLAEAAFGQRYSKCCFLLSARKHSENIFVFTRLWRFLNTHLNVYLMTVVSVFWFTLKFLSWQLNTKECYIALPSDRRNGKVLKLVLSENKPTKPFQNPSNPPKNRMEVGKEASKYFRHHLGVEKGRRVVDVMGQCKQGSEVRRAWPTAIPHPLEKMITWKFQQQDSGCRAEIHVEFSTDYRFWSLLSHPFSV